MPSSVERTTVGPRSYNSIVLDAAFREFHEVEYPELAADDAFERYATVQVLKPRDLSSDELVSGIVDGEHDGGVDGFFVFLNGVLLSPDDPVLVPGHSAVRQVGTRPDLEIVLIQAKNSDHWEEAAWQKLLSSLPSLLDIDADDAVLEDRFRPAVVEQTGIFRRALKALGARFPSVSFPQTGVRYRQNAHGGSCYWQTGQPVRGNAGEPLPGVWLPWDPADPGRLGPGTYTG